MTITALKEYILEQDKIEYILLELGCHNIKEFSKEYRCGLPNHNSTNNVVINNQTLSMKIFTSDSDTKRGDIITLVMYIKNISFVEANKYLHSLLGLEYKFAFKEKKLEKIDPLQIFKKVKRKRYIVNVDELEVYDENLIKEYIPLPYISWVREGILPFTCEKFKIGYSADKKRITIPERYWCGEDNDFIGIMGRTVIENYEMFDIPKYLPLKAFPKSINIYGLQENYESIQDQGFVVVAESQKSVLKRHSRKDETCVSIGCHDISDEQVKILIGLDVAIIIAFDKGISLQHIRYTCEKFYGIREVSYIYDKYDIMKDKQAPMDLPNKTYQYLFKYKINYDVNEHNQYINERDKNEKRI